MGDKTKITLRMVFESAQEVERVIKVFGAIEGGNQTLARLAEYLPSLGNANDSPTGELSLTRVFDAPRELVWSAWTDAKHLAQWWGPQGYTNPVREVDARPGGAIRIQMIALDGTVYPIKGEFKEVVTPERLVFVETICVPSDTSDGAQNLLFELLNTITFAEQAGKTNVTIKARVLRMTAAGAPYAAGMEEGWMQSLDRLAVFLAKR